VHLIRNTFRLTSKRDWDAMKRDVKQIYTAVSADAARAALDELAGKWGRQYGAVIRLWESAWEQFIPFLDYDAEIRTVICSTNAIESLNARYRRAVRARGTSRPSRPRSSASTSSPAPLTPPGTAGQGGRCGGSQP
jgi:putative transposase